MRWVAQQFDADHFQNASDVAENVVVPKSCNAIAMIFDFLGSSIIGNRGLGVLTAINFNHHFPRWTSKVGDACADRVLTTESEFGKILPQGAPKGTFGIGGVAPQPSC